MNKIIKHLFKLLDDENPQSASLAMAELLSIEGKEVEVVLRKMQETENPRLRKRIHQLQSIMSIRKRRKLMAGSFMDKGIDLFEGLLQIHLLWYDNDSEEGMTSLWNQLLEESSKSSLNTIEKLGKYMLDKGFSCSSRDDIDADFYCIGIVLEEMTGADFILCSIGKLIAQKAGLDLKIIHVNGSYVLIDRHGQILFPANWDCSQKLGSGVVREWDNHMIFKLTSSLILVHALTTDSFRYIHTIGSFLSRSSGIENADFLPYPYGGNQPQTGL